MLAMPRRRDRRAVATEWFGICVNCSRPQILSRKSVALVPRRPPASMTKGTKQRSSWVGSKTLLHCLVFEASLKRAALPGLEQLPARLAVWHPLLVIARSMKKTSRLRETIMSARLPGLPLRPGTSTSCVSTVPALLIRRWSWETKKSLILSWLQHLRRTALRHPRP